MRKLITIALLLVAVGASASWFDSPDSREKAWRNDPTLGLRRSWFFSREDYGRKIRWSQMLQFRAVEFDRMVMRTEAQYGPPKQTIEESSTFKYRVVNSGINKDGLPVVEIMLADSGATWVAVLYPREEKMDLYIGGFYMGKYIRPPK